jgi:hypothetical protein
MRFRRFKKTNKQKKTTTTTKNPNKQKKLKFHVSKNSNMENSRRSPKR